MTPKQNQTKPFFSLQESLGPVKNRARGHSDPQYLDYRLTCTENAFNSTSNYKKILTLIQRGTVSPIFYLVVQIATDI